MIAAFEYQYLTNIEKGMTVIYGNRCYRVQDDGKGNHLHIITFEQGKRKKISIEQLKKKQFEPGSTADYIFNEWWKIYNSEKTFKQFADAEISWL